MTGEKPGLVRIVTAIYQDVIANRRNDQNFWILSAFVPTFLTARLLVHFIPHLFLHVHGTHVHHFTYGFVILAITGYIATTSRRRAPWWLAALFGVGLALSIDETGMWLHLTAQYYNETSENALIIVTALLVNLVYFREFWLRLVVGVARWLGHALANK